MARAYVKFFRDRRAITPVLSNLLLTLVAVAAMAIATTATYVITTNLRENMGERFIVEDVWFNPSGEIAIYVRNTGKVTIQISAVYINHTKYAFTFQSSLDVDEHGWLNVLYNWSSGSLYHIDVVTNRGNHVAGYYKAP
ncbi:MAG: hypothetical protein QXZ25_01650 [Candidatus Bathyarchaeia archaeon]